jgi:anti-sigma-K factor RskA
MEPGIHELTAGYALDALDAEERRTYEAHLPDCERCREELASFWNVSEALAVASSGPAPAPDLRDRILAAARAEPPVVVPFEPKRRRRPLVPVLAAAAAVAAGVAIGLGVWAASLSNDLDSSRSAVAKQREALEIVADPNAQTVALKTGTGRLVVAPDGRAALALTGLDPAPAGKTYEIWVIAGSTPSPSGLFPGQTGADLVTVDGMVGTGDVVAVTVEKAGGVDAPTTPIIVQSEPA